MCADMLGKFALGWASPLAGLILLLFTIAPIAQPADAGQMASLRQSRVRSFGLVESQFCALGTSSRSICNVRQTRNGRNRVLVPSRTATANPHTTSVVSDNAHNNDGRILDDAMRQSSSIAAVSSRR
jgi:hypothetical protein